MKYNKKIRNAAGFLAVVWAVATLVACGSGATSSTYTMEATPDYYGMVESPAIAYDDAAYMVEMDAAEIIAEDSAMLSGEANSTAARTSEGEIYPEADRKIIMNAWITLEALEYDKASLAIDRIINEHGAYISNSGIYNSTVGYRSADYTVRVPADNYRPLLAALEDAGNMVSRSESSEDVTTQYIDIEARLTSLRAQEDRLMDLMAEAGDLESLILVQQQLSEVQYQIEYYEGLQRSYDRQITYSTVQIHLYEVVEYTEPEPEGYLSQISRAFANGWKNALDVVQGIGLAIVGGLPLIIALAIAAVVVVVLLRRSRKRSAQRLAKWEDMANVAVKEEPKQDEDKK